jgi:hypothetical protein
MDGILANIKTRLSKDSRFFGLIVIFLIAILAFRSQPHIAMWIGFVLAGYSAIANDSVQSLGSFISSNRYTKWWYLWLFLGSILVAVFTYGWMQGDVSYERLAKIPEVDTFNLVQLLAPLALLILTRLKMPVSTTFLLLAVFTDSKTITSMLEKTFMGYFLAFVSAIIIWAIIAEMKNKKIFFSEKYNESTWRILQWIATAYLWSTWLMQDTANIVVFLPRDISLTQIIVINTIMFFGMGLLLYMRGGRIQEIIQEKTDVVDPRSATVIDFVFGTILVYFKNINNLPMSTTWVFLGLLAGREVALSRLSKDHDQPYLRTLGLVMKDLGLASVGLLVSIGLAALA